ncbi:DEAD/DEAH box helicase [Natribacillus halophilus]|uniref:Competence protein ComFA n=1 Tax=Natribacillus halophilus TaxID=549003 RepID=A0A1G8KNY7_9BACI|nr:DEAD/DEAH box helicase [Natribacillus halophilus]SDI45154.1 competence protein ComFA [Natribacillus halophilus]
MKVVIATPRNVPSPLMLPLACVKDHDNVQSDPAPISTFTNPPPPPSLQETSEPLSDLHLELQGLLTGRALLPDEFPFPYTQIESFIRSGYVYLQAGIKRGKSSRHQCQRCGNTKKDWFARYDCAWCNGPCLYCRRCVMMGRVTTCTPLFRWGGPVFSAQERRHDVLAWQGELSPLQRRAADRITETIMQHKAAKLLVWAVCGAGKTEMLFPGIARGLEEGKRVLIATPRTDVVLELEPRLRRAFPTTTLASLYGGSPERLAYGQLVVATTHQTRRFQDAFDVAIIDEVDAFPYRYDESLAYAVKNATRKQAVLIYLTATPDEGLRKKCEKEKAVVKVSRRFHGYPLPVPEFQWAGNWRKALAREHLSPVFSAWVDEQLTSGRQALIFAPSVQVAKQLHQILQKKETSIVSVHASDPERKEIVKRFRDGEMPLLITTTILERGVTIYGIDVVVLGAEDDVFVESALVQIAGRAGRSADDPHGTVTFFHYGKTKAMNRCRKQILAMNRGEHQDEA